MPKTVLLRTVKLLHIIEITFIAKTEATDAANNSDV